MNSAYYFEELEDVRDEVRQFEKGLSWAVFALVVGTAMTIGGQILRGVILFLNDAGVAITVLGGVIFCCSLIFGVIWLCARGYPEDKTNIYRRLREAQRAYDRELSREGERAAKGES